MPYEAETHFVERPSYHATLHDVWLVRGADQWGNPKFAAFDEQGLPLRENGFNYSARHRRTLLAHRNDAPCIDSVCWPYRSWPKNHCHWILEDLPSVLLARELGLGSDLVMPGAGWATPFNKYCVKLLGSEQLPNTDLIAPVLRVKRLHIVRAMRYRPESLNSVRDFLTPIGAEPTRRIYICRAAAQYRRVVNAKEIQEGLEKRGFDSVQMEKLNAEQQIGLMANSSMVVGLHGAGMANIAFCPRHTGVIEVLDSRWRSQNQDVYRKCAALAGLCYAAIGGSTDRSTKPAGYRDIEIDTREFFSVVDQIAEAQQGE